MAPPGGGERRSPPAGWTAACPAGPRAGPLPASSSSPTVEPHVRPVSVSHVARVHSIQILPDLTWQSRLSTSPCESNQLISGFFSKSFFFFPLTIMFVSAIPGEKKKGHFTALGSFEARKIALTRTSSFSSWLVKCSSSQVFDFRTPLFS